MKEKIPCTKCGALILPETAERTEGLCMPCKQGNRESIEASKEYYKKLKEYDPVRELWKSLVERVHHSEAGLDGLNEAEKIYYTVCVLNGEVFNGGFEQFFSNNSGEYYKMAVDGLFILQAFQCLKLLKEAKDILFYDNAIPSDHIERYESMKKLSEEEEHRGEIPDWSLRLDQIDAEYYKDPDDLYCKLDQYAEIHGLVEPFKRNVEQAAGENASRPTA
ncbi:MAG: DUF4375 domain-containing protein [Verrucomicrobia bacterium]|nr:DUF4375 domain-containing protein [Verrucomicrobiota bacterium]MCH8513992.1 DMP19 family protein [Kiritimatiellia bacterium]